MDEFHLLCLVLQGDDHGDDDGARWRSVRLFTVFSLRRLLSSSPSSRSFPEIHLQVAGTLSNQQTTSSSSPAISLWFTILGEIFCVCDRFLLLLVVVFFFLLLFFCFLVHPFR